MPCKMCMWDDSQNIHHCFLIGFVPLFTESNIVSDTITLFKSPDLGRGVIGPSIESDIVLLRSYDY